MNIKSCQLSTNQVEYATPFFFAEKITEASKEFILNEETSRHVVQVLRMQKGEQLQLTNGKGEVLTGEITSSNLKSTEVKILSTDNSQRSTKITIAISLIKNNVRFEWFLEKATEIGVSEIIPLICERTEKQHFRYDRMKGILISAMLQSRQAWLPLMHEPVKFIELIKRSSYYYKYIAHCSEGEKKQLSNETHLSGKQDFGLSDKIIFIGPEGDFSKNEIDEALKNEFIEVSLGSTRLRTETAGVVAAVLFNNSH
jgi:16S rRNA (uracil1498-N3)-methyltransferase